MGNTIKTSRKRNGDPIARCIHQRQLLDYIDFYSKNREALSLAAFELQNTIRPNLWTRYADSFRVHRNNLRDFTPYSSRVSPSLSIGLSVKELSTEIVHYGRQSPALRSLDIGYDAFDLSIREVMTQIGEKLVSLKQLKLCWRSPDLSSKTLELIGVQISRLLGLHTIDFKFYKTGEINPFDSSAFEKLVYCIFRYLDKLQELSLGFFSCIHTLSGPFNPDFDLIKSRRPSLKKLTLSFRSCLRNSALHVFKFIGKLEKLQQLNLSFSECYKLTNEDLRYLIRIIKNLVNLESLTLSIQKSPEINDTGLFYIHVELLPPLINLKTLKLDLSMSSVSKCEVRNFAHSVALSKHPLKKLILNVKHLKDPKFWDEIRSKLKSIPIVDLNYTFQPNL